MRALVKAASGPGNLGLQDIPIPEIGDDDILMKVSFCGVCGSDLHIETGIHPCDPPVAIGHEFSGVAAKTGRNVTGFKEGDAVAFWRGWSPFPCDAPNPVEGSIREGTPQGWYQDTPGPLSLRFHDRLTPLQISDPGYIFFKYPQVIGNLPS